MSHTHENLLAAQTTGREGHAHAHNTASSEPAVVRHPLDPLTSAELSTGRAILVAAGLLGETVRCAQVLPVEPDKDVVASFTEGDPIERRVHYVLLDTATGAASEVIVSVTGNEVVERESLANDQAPYGQPQYLFDEYDRAAEIAKASPEWQAAMHRRGLGDRIELAFCAPLAPGFFGRDDETGRRVIRSLTFLRDSETDSPWAHPVEGLIVHINLSENGVIRVED